MQDKTSLRAQLRSKRREHVEGLPEAISALLFQRPPSPVCECLPDNAVIGLYSAGRFEAPTAGYAKWFHEHGHRLALPWFSDRDATMEFRSWDDPYQQDALVPDPFGALQPPEGAAVALPDVVFVPLLGFTEDCDRIGQGQGHYDRWLALHPHVVPIGLAWDCQRVEFLPVEPHDLRLAMVVTPSRVHEGPA